MNTIAISNYKGGVGKTTTAVNLATLFAKNGKRVLLIDLDPQASATDYFGLYGEAESTGLNSISLLYGNAPVEKVTHETKIPNLSMVPSLIDLIDQNELMLREQRLKFALDDASDDYDIAIVDCSPVMKRLAFNAYLAAADGGLVIVPVKLDSSVMRGTALTVNATRAIADALRMPTPRFKILRAVRSRPRDAQRGNGCGGSRPFLPERPTPNRDPLFLEGDGGQLAMAAGRGIRPEEPRRKGLCRTRGGGLR